MRGAQDPAPIDIASDQVIVDLQTRVGSIEERNIRRDAQQAEIIRAVAQHGKILTKQARILANPDHMLAF